jgi:cell division protein FtsW
MFFVAGASIIQMATLAAAGVVVGAFLMLGAGYRADRLASFLNQSDDPAGGSFQVNQSVIAIGSGGLDGIGLGASRAKFFYIPESHTDGVFAIISEELGLAAGLSVMMLFTLFTVRGYTVAARSRDQFGMLVATGITTWIIAQALLNIGGITRSIPLTGVPLPFLSFGGNALAAVMMAAGVLINISRYQRDRGGYMDRAPNPTGSRRVIRRKRVMT